MPRTYSVLKPVTPLKVVKPVEAIPPDAKLHDLEETSKLLTDQFSGGFSVKSLRRLIKSDWTEGTHYLYVRKRLKFYLPAIQDWVVSGGSGRSG
ncbi:hypothetical protein NIES2135_54460 [Leptolyngbya boryana NIES-2135]|uniref:Uncharacterized protein n=1 Tax=Leptolyngbya boryana NIES-2135 TaxID=1973484 RepID=A0A1Z4JPJ1_LEPBY|nr:MULTISPECIES: hypothetical protein [Leptolyngbya]BAY58573.1 hypothetical protein NIES2135_54460 [Leptolyngbya boryana NIES-2135]MBD2370751.1 hypothetical protein [Leptolyngbya sp. FACHB-161]MBD2377096.1 hypothetical protein [Leptolyngbya sp. FACHB-238]MBD2401539.1 hypothetical protein [Leptolyngbya sp. FACHB-239]MBD2408091.1 hypothetical protein [Leptolyngbya sp. FACHB-402]